MARYNQKPGGMDAVLKVHRTTLDERCRALGDRVRAEHADPTIRYSRLPVEQRRPRP
jgi:hypothetical protein